MVIVLDRIAILRARAVGLARDGWAERRGLPDYGPAQTSRGNSRFSHILGACGEMAIHVWTGLPWKANVGLLDQPDVGRLQVRTRSRHSGRLYVRATDDLASIYILITTEAKPDQPIPRAYTVRGWIRGTDAREVGEFVRENGAAWFVPNAKLNPPTSLFRVAMEDAHAG